MLASTVLLAVLHLSLAAPTPLVMIDAGHGGTDAGAERAGVREKDVNLTVARLLGQELQKKGLRVAYTRTSDCPPHLNTARQKHHCIIGKKTRVQLTTNSRADLFVSIHCDAMLNSGPHGPRAFCSPVAKAGCSFAERMQTSLNTVRDRPMPFRREMVYVLSHQTVPAALVELGFLSNAADRQRLISRPYQMRLVNAMVPVIVVQARAVRPDPIHQGGSPRVDPAPDHGRRARVRPRLSGSRILPFHH